LHEVERGFRPEQRIAYDDRKKDMVEMNINEIKEKLAGQLKKSRFLHSVGVADCAADLAAHYGADVEKAYLAGLLHDCARTFATVELVSVASGMQLPVTEIEMRTPILLHAAIGAAMLPEQYQIEDEQIRQAICFHTVGGPAMTDLDKIVYLADMIEPGRRYPGVDELRRLTAIKTLDQVLLAAFNQSIAFVLNKNNVIHPDTVAARNEILLKE